MQVAISQITNKMMSALQAKGYDDADIPFIINMYLGGELRGHTSHGLAGFTGFVNHDLSKLDKPQVVKETRSLFMINAKSNSGISIIKSMDNWLRPGAVAEYIADQGLVAIIVNSGRGAATAPPGGYDPVTGTNPIAYGIPTDDGALVVDMATSKQAWGQVRLANKYGTDLPADTFYNDQGNVTVDPKQAWSVMSFGEYKGFSLALLIEILCGSLVGAPMMVQSTAKNSFGGKHPDTNAMIMVIDPAQTAGLDEFRKSNSELLARIKATRARNGETIRIPGEQAGQEQAARLKSGVVEIPEELWEEIKSL